MIHETLKVFSADSINCGTYGGEFGRFSPNTRVDSITLETNDEGHWFIGLPFGSSLWVGNNEEEEVRERFTAICESAISESGFDQFHWRTNNDKVEADSRRSAIRRHNESCERSTYVAKFGQKIDVEKVGLK